MWINLIFCIAAFIGPPPEGTGRLNGRGGNRPYSSVSGVSGVSGAGLRRVDRGGRAGYAGYGGQGGYGWEGEELIWLIRTTIRPESWR